MTPDQFNEKLKALSWKQSDFCRMTGVNKSTPSRWMMEATEIPLWVEGYLNLTLELDRLHKTYVRPPKGTAEL